MERYLQEKYDESYDAQFHYWHDLAVKNPEDTLKKIDAELKVLYVRLENDQEGRGLVGETGLTAVVSGMEAARAECLQLIKTT